MNSSENIPNVDSELDSEEKKPEVAEKTTEKEVDPDKWLKDTFGKTEEEMGTPSEMDKASRLKAGEKEQEEV